MIYRILTDGKKFRVQKGWNFGWDYLTVYSGYDYEPMEFITEEGAENYMTKRFGSEAKRILQWRII